MKASTLLRAGAAPVILLLGLAAPCAAADISSSVPVKTSRGDYYLLVYAPKEERNRPPVLLMSGEGGWRRFDQMLAGYFRDAGHWVGGVDTMKYFWHPQDDRQVLASDMRMYARELVKAAGRKEGTPVILAGFSFGADLAPWIAGAGGWDNRLAGLVMLGPDLVGSLQFRILEIMGMEQKDHVFPVGEALASVKGVPILFIHGGKDPHSDAPPLFEKAPDPKKLLTVPESDHHFSGHEEDLRSTLEQGLVWLLSPAPTPAAPAKGDGR
jgi:type IV secretory pathway VirJ component